MKRILIAILASALLTGLILVGVNLFKSNSNGSTSYYLVASNVNEIYDTTFTAQSNTQHSLPYYCPSLPEENIERMKMIQGIENVYSYYPMFIYNEFENEKLSIVYRTNNSDSRTLDLPLYTYASNGEQVSYQEFRIKSTFDQEKIRKYYKETFYKKFDSDSGIFIPKTLYDYLDVNESSEQLLVTLPVQIPVVAEVVTTAMKTNTVNFSYENYAAIKYEIVYHTFEIEGVIDSSYGRNFTNGIDILVPYESVSNLYKEIDLNSIELDENQVLWQPNCYIVECNSNMKINELGKKIEAELNSYFIKAYDHGDNSDPYNYLFKDGDCYIK